MSGYFPYFDKAIVLEQTLLLDPHVDVIELVVYDDYHTVEPKVDRLKVARSRLGNTNYGLLTNNCEAFMHELCVGLRYSRQAELISDLMQMLLYVPFLALLHLYYGTLISNLCMALLLLLLYAWYNTCLFLLHKFSVLSYFFYFPECY